MEIAGKTALVTGSSRGLGRHFAEQLRDRGAKVYASARDPKSVDLDGVTPIRLDVTDADSVMAAAELAGDVSIVINNAGTSTRTPLLEGSMENIKLEMDTHYYGMLAVIRAFAPKLAVHGESAVLNVLSVVSWLSRPPSGSLCAAKSAAWSMTNALRQELAPQGTIVHGLHVGYMETGMTTGLVNAKSDPTDPADVARQGLDGIEHGDVEILVDEISQAVRAGLSGGVAALYPLQESRSDGRAWVNRALAASRLEIERVAGLPLPSIT